MDVLMCPGLCSRLHSFPQGLQSTHPLAKTVILVFLATLKSSHNATWYMSMVEQLTAAAFSAVQHFNHSQRT